MQSKNKIPRVLVIEPNGLHMKFVMEESQLRADRFELIWVQTIEEAKEVFARDSKGFEVIVVDTSPFANNGLALELLSEIKNSGFSGRLICSGKYGSLKRRAFLTKLGCQLFCTKMEILPTILASI